MKNFIVYDEHGKILRTGFCQDNTFYLQAQDGEFVIKGKANAATQKVVGIGVDGKVVDKTPEEIEAAKPPQPKQIPERQQTANITNEQLESIVQRLDKLETKQ